jgi:predicted O-methyltransferase YrrM
MLSTFRRIGSSLSKRMFWRSHLRDAVRDLSSFKKELPAPEAMIAIPLVFRGKGFYNSMSLKQNMTELLGLVNLLRERDLKTVCEIGTLKGGTLFIWCQLAAQDAAIFSIDLPHGQFGGGYNEKSLPFFQAFLKSGQTLDCLRGDSHSKQIRDQFFALLKGRELDFLFIDGDHSYGGVKKDYEDYSPFVRKGGVVAFHDIVRRDNDPTIEVWKFWHELKTAHPNAVEFVEDSPERRKIGIGAVIKP